MNHLPIWDDLENELVCEAFKLELPTEIIKSKDIHYDEENERVVCIFEDFHDFSRTYFAVTSK